MTLYTLVMRENPFESLDDAMAANYTIPLNVSLGMNSTLIHRPIFGSYMQVLVLFEMRMAATDSNRQTHFMAILQDHLVTPVPDTLLSQFIDSSYIMVLELHFELMENRLTNY